MVGDIGDVDDLILQNGVTTIDESFFVYITEGEGVTGMGKIGKRVLLSKSEKTNQTIKETKYDVLLFKGCSN